MCGHTHLSIQSARNIWTVLSTSSTILNYTYVCSFGRISVLKTLSYSLENPELYKKVGWISPVTSDAEDTVQTIQLQTDATDMRGSGNNCGRVVRPGL